MYRRGRSKYYYKAIFCIIAILCICHKAYSLEPLDDSFSKEIVVGRNPASSRRAPDTPSQLTGTAKIILRFSSSAVMKITSQEAQNILEDKVIPLCKSFEFVRDVYWDKSNAQLSITVDTQDISAESAGWKLRDALSSKLGLRILDVAVRR